MQRITFILYKGIVLKNLNEEYMENIEQKTKKCPYCGADIPIEARKCRYCGEWVDSSHEDGQTEQSAQPSKQIPLSDPVPSSFKEATKRCTGVKYLIYEGRASKKEFWCYFVLYLLFSIVSFGLLYAAVDMADSDPSVDTCHTAAFLVLISIIVGVGFGLPFLAVGTRRLHDTGKSGWYWLWGLVPCIGGLILLYFWAQPSDGDNEYGTDPVFNSAPESQKKYKPTNRDLFITIIIGGISLLLGFFMALGLWYSADSESEPVSKSTYEQPANDEEENDDGEMADADTAVSDYDASSSSDEQESSSDETSWVDAGYYEGTMDGYPMAIDLTKENESDCSGVYKNLDAGTKMNLTGTTEGNEVFLEGEVAGSTYRFNLTQVEEGVLKGSCTINEKRMKNVRLRLKS